VNAALPLAAALAFGAAPSAAERPDSKAVDAAIERGLDWLLAAQNRDGSWGTEINERGSFWHDYRNGSSAFAVYTLLKCGLPNDHPAVLRGLAFLEAVEPTHTYGTAVSLMALAATGDVDRRARMERLLEILLALEAGETGRWDYPWTSGRSDLSNTQVAVLGLSAAQHAGLEVPKRLWSRVVDGALDFQTEPAATKGARSGSGGAPAAGFRYEPGGGEGPSGSLTCAGIAVTALAADGLGTSLAAGTRSKIERSQELALEWLAQHWSLDGNPGGNPAFHYYYLYALERVGSLLRVETIAGHDWYSEGVLQLLKEQRPDGSWHVDGWSTWPPAPMPVANTCFGLLFLRRATRVSTGIDAREVDLEKGVLASEPPGGAVWFRARIGVGAALWITGLGGRADGEEQVVEVEWLVDGKVAAKSPGDPGAPWKDGPRLGAYCAFETGGKHTLACRVTLAQPDGTEVVARSAALEIDVRRVLEPWMLGYADDETENALRAATARATASSSSEHCEPGDAIDGLQGRAWTCSASDAAPWIRIEIERAAKAEAIVLSQAPANDHALAGFATVRRVRVRVNGSKTASEHELDADWRRKTMIPLAKKTPVKLLEVSILERDDPARPAGFAEIELR
jgi:squalene-hopene/tetraprenyl-beta-curcumene cyclase